VKPTCYASQHLSPEEHGVLDVCMRLTSGGRRPFCLDGRTLASRFGRCNKNTIYRIVAALVEQGWLIKTGGGERNTATGKYGHTTYKVMSHTQWAKVHKNVCLGASPVPESGQDQSRFERKPVPESGHSFVSTSVLETSVKENKDAETKKLFQHDSHFSEESSEESIGSPVEYQVIPSAEFIEFRTLLESSGFYGLREIQRDNGALQKLWNMAGGTTDERADKVREALMNGIDQAGANGQGIETVMFWAEMTMRGGAF
jgi:hypothetical protein